MNAIAPQLNPHARVALPSRPSWRDRAYGTETPAARAPARPVDSPATSRRRSLNWGQRRTKFRYLRRASKIVDTIHVKRSQIAARLAAYSQQQQQSVEGEEDLGRARLMLTYPGYEHPLPPSPAPAPEPDIKPTAETDASHLDGLTLKDNTKLKKSLLNKLPNVEKKEKPKPQVKRNYVASGDWREELKNRDKARQMEAMEGYKIGMPEYKEPDLLEKEAAAAEAKPNIPDNKWAKTGGQNWQRKKLKPAIKQSVETLKEENNEEPFKINLKPVKGRNTNKEQGKIEDPVVINKLGKWKSQISQGKQNVEKEQENGKDNYPETFPPETNQIQEKLQSETPTKTFNIKRKKPKEETKLKSLKSKEEPEQKYVIKVINFVAIKVAVEDTPAPARQRKPDRKKSAEKPPIPRAPPPALPQEATLQTYTAQVMSCPTQPISNVYIGQECEIECIKEEIANMLHKSDYSIDNEILNAISQEIIRETTTMSRVEVKKEKVLSCPKPILTRKTRDEKSFDEKYFQPRKKKVIEYIPDNTPVKRTPKKNEINVSPMKFSSVADNCITKSLFVGSQYVGRKE